MAMSEGIQRKTVFSTIWHGWNPHPVSVLHPSLKRDPTQTQRRECLPLCTRIEIRYGPEAGHEETSRELRNLSQVALEPTDRESALALTGAGRPALLLLGSK